MKLLIVILSVVAVGWASAPASGQSWTEAGDAGDLPGSAQAPLGSGVLTDISGTIGAANDVDMYCIHIDTPGYTASTCNAPTTVDTQLWLFDLATGNGVTCEDDAGAAACPLSGLRSILDLVDPPAGDYYIAVSRFNRDAHSPGGSMWLSTVEGPPNGPGAPGPVTLWVGSTTVLGPYKIDLTGVSYSATCQPVPVEQTTWGSIKSIYRK